MGMSRRVALVIGDVTSDELALLVQQMPVWIPEGMLDTESVRRLREGAPERDRLTTFMVFPEETPATAAWGIVPDIDLHHGEMSFKPGYSELHVYGVEAKSFDLRDFKQFGFKRIERYSDRRFAMLKTTDDPETR